jgi:hypothetical protein
MCGARGIYIYIYSIFHIADARCLALQRPLFSLYVLISISTSY